MALKMFLVRMMKIMRVFVVLGCAVVGAKPFVGFNIGTDVSKEPYVQQTVSLLLKEQITHVRLYDLDKGMLLALANTSIEVLLSVPNNQVLAIGESNSTAANWVNKNVAVYLPDTKITGIVVGNEVLTTLPNAALVLVQGMKFLHSALVAANLDGQVKVTSSHSFDIIRDEFPPSQAYFNQSLNKVIVSMLEFLHETDSYLMMNVYPYYKYVKGNGKVPLDLALFQPVTADKEAVDPTTLLHYTNLFDAMVDAIYFSLSTLNFTNVSVVVGETGWPSRGDAGEPQASMENADTYNSNLVMHILNKTGTPKKPGTPVNTYIYELYNEDLKSGPVSEQNWGLFQANGTPVYVLRLTGAGGFLVNDTTNRTFCVAKPGADSKLLQAGLDWACGSGQANCSAIQGGEACFNPDTVKDHASYAFNNYYHATGMALGSCDFNGVGTITTADPSYGSCFYNGSARGNPTSGNATTHVVGRSTEPLFKDKTVLRIFLLFLSIWVL